MALVQDTTATELPPALIASVEAWPNPFNAGTSVSFTNSESGGVTVGIYDIQGRLMRLLVNGVLAADSYVEHWDGRDDSGHLLSSGVYFARMRAGSEEVSAKLVLVK